MDIDIIIRDAIAFIIVVAVIVMTILKVQVPDYLQTVALIVIGYYFRNGTSILKRQQAGV